MGMSIDLLNVIFLTYAWLTMFRVNIFIDKYKEQKREQKK